MIIHPAHGALDDVVEHFEAGFERHIDPSPNLGLGIDEADANPRDLVGHAAMHRGELAAVQFHMWTAPSCKG